MAKGTRQGGYVPAYSDLTRHEKTLRVADRLRIRNHGPQAVAGYLVTLWNRCAQENIPTPEGGPLPEDRIEHWAEWGGKRGAFFDALLEAGFIERHQDGRLYLHDWEHGGGRIVAARDRWRRNKTPDEEESNEEFRAESNAEPNENSTIESASQIRSDLSSPTENDPPLPPRKRGGGASAGRRRRSEPPRERPAHMPAWTAEQLEAAPVDLADLPEAIQ